MIGQAFYFQWLAHYRDALGLPPISSDGAVRAWDAHSEADHAAWVALAAGDADAAKAEAEVERLREALHRIERLKDRWSAPLTHPAGDMRDPAYAGAAAWAAVGSEAHKIATDALREPRASEDRP